MLAIQSKDWQLQDTQQTASLEKDGVEVELHGCVVSRRGLFGYWTLVVCTAGLAYVASVWYPGIYARLVMRPAQLALASHIHIQQNDKQLALERVIVSASDGSFESGFSESKERAHCNLTNKTELRAFSFRHHCFVFCPSFNAFFAVSQWKDAAWTRGTATRASGLSNNVVAQRMRVFGKCNIDIQEKSYLQLLWEEALNPLYVFQVASIVIWCVEEYYYYSAAIFVISLASIGSTLVSTKHTARRVRAMANYVCAVRVLRSNVWSDMESSELVPGDVIDLAEPGLDVVPCDMVLLEGNCIVDESMLTGESVPESKVSVVSGDHVLESIDMAAHTFDPAVSRHIVFAGTRIIRTRKARSSYPGSSSNSAKFFRATAMVLRTGFCTTKGTLVRSILFPHATKFRFYHDAMRFVWCLAGIACIGFIVNTINLHRLGVSAGEIAIKALDLITVAVPPALPASMSIGMVFAARRLRKAGIFCISPSRINVASKVAAVVFDKTGTLTDQGMDVLGVQVASRTHREFDELQTEVCGLEDPATMQDTEDAKVGVRVLSVDVALATCHSLSIVDGALVGDPLEIKMVEFSGWHIDERNATSDPHESALITACPPQSSRQDTHIIARCFEFAPELRRSSVVTSDLNGRQHAAYVKGAPEVIRDLCHPESVPKNYDAVLNTHTQGGYRVISLAGRVLDVDTAQLLNRTSVECDLVFLGFLIFENRLKPATASVLCELRDARIRTIMCTGDNPLTAVSVAQECSLIAPGTTVFVSHLRQPAPCLHENMFVPLACVEWKESTGQSIELDPVTLIPRSTDPHSTCKTELDRPYCLAITGPAFAYFEQHARDTPAWKHMLMRGAVFARMSPEQKAALVDQLQQLGYISGFCGDGANDCAALKTADIGVSLSEAEASVAAPFTSHVNDISCIVQLVREGRCSIATSIACFKYLGIYSIIQFTTCCILYSYDVNLTNGQFLFVDLFAVLPITVCLDRFEPFSQLVPRRPTASLASKRIITSLLGHTVLTAGFQLSVFAMTASQSWYHAPEPATPGDPDSTPEKGDLNTILFVFSAFQYVFMGVVFAIGPPYRQRAIRNYAFLLVVASLLAFELGVLLGPLPGLRSLFALVKVQVGWRFVVFGMAVANFVMCYFGERVVFPRVAAPAAKMCRLVRLVFTGRFTEIAHRNGTRGLVGMTDLESELPDVRIKPSLWTYLGLRPGRKEYKTLAHMHGLSI
ncbi:hypothetical protein GGH12_003257 [Coemansia sp. RSA 1822]|nr:hypothetical protein LPJ76_005205 [Coemansia sp. RSA 638]KAJ2562406.1 hypothetical protein GGH12_003257 [Coemansia sp. RSA 1822]